MSGRFSPLSAPFPLYDLPLCAPLLLHRFLSHPLTIRSTPPDFQFAPLHFPLRSHALDSDQSMLYTKRVVVHKTTLNLYVKTAWILYYRSSISLESLLSPALYLNVLNLAVHYGVTRSCATAQKTAVGHSVFADAIHTASFARSRVYSHSR